MFENNRIPHNWLASLRSNIHELSIIRGNLNHLPCSAFISQFTSFTKTLTLQELKIKTWTTNSLVGFSSLENLNVIDSRLHYFQANSLRAVDDTLKSLTITNSGRWDPANVTGARGFEKLHIVDFSNNDFHKILGEGSFVGLEHCKILFLNSCGIVGIGAGAFDHLKSIEVLYLNNNRLVTIPPGLFQTIVSLEYPKPRISLQDNLWHCSCMEDDLRQLVRKEIQLVETTCTYPEAMNGKTFTEFDDSCDNQIDDLTPTPKQQLRYYYDVDSNLTYVHGTCQKTRSIESPTTFSASSRTFQIVTPKKCSLNKTKFIDISSLSPQPVNGNISNKNSSWLTFSYFFQTTMYNALQIGAAETHDYGLLWFQSDCPLEMYCMDSMPTSLRIFDIDQYSQFTFCPLRLSTGDIEEDRCVAYSMDSPKATKSTQSVLKKWLLYLTLVLFCTSFGAIVVYSLIRANPTLLKGSKRILFVKHKMVDALVLPTKVPLSHDTINDTCNSNKNNIFTLHNDSLIAPKFNTMKSIRSNKSGSPSYVSAFQPSKDQLAEWRISNHFNNDLTINSKSELSTLWVSGDAPYYSFDGSDTTYESLK